MSSADTDADTDTDGPALTCLTEPEVTLPGALVSPPGLLPALWRIALRSGATALVVPSSDKTGHGYLGAMSYSSAPTVSVTSENNGHAIPPCTSGPADEATAPDAGAVLERLLAD